MENIRLWNFGKEMGGKHQEPRAGWRSVTEGIVRGDHERNMQETGPHKHWKETSF